MLSILIPVYNFDVRPFVTGLHEQCAKSGIEYEIICVDDRSEQTFIDLNTPLSDLENVSFISLDKNIGRSRIRNFLAEKARYPYLLFVDCDSAVVDDRYIANYVKFLNPKTLLYGGRSYQLSKPDQIYALHWKYGSVRESKKAEARNRFPYKSFMTNNFVVPADTFKSIQFDENIVGYGHEDTLFGKQLGLKNIAIHHIDNPLNHIGLEDTETFIRKTEEAVKNLVILHKQGKLQVNDARLIQAYYAIKRFGFGKVVSKNIQRRENQILAKLKLPDPSLRLYDQWKLMLFSKHMNA